MLTKLRSPWVPFSLVWILIALISARSHYDIRDVHSINWDIALMLSPYGFLHNFILDPANYLRPYYDVAAKRGDLFGDPVLDVFLVLTVTASFAGLWLFRRANGKPR